MAKQTEDSVNLDEFIGTNNQKSIHELSPKELALALNVDFTDDGKFRRRVGFTNVYLGDCRSLYSNSTGAVALFMQGQTLYRFNDDYTVKALKTGLDPLLRMSYEEANGNIYFSNDKDSGVIDNITATSENVREWGIIPPSSPPTLSLGNGSLYAGKYGFAISFVAPDGRESVTSLEETIEIPVGTQRGINLSGIQSSPEAEFVQVYMTDPNGTTYHRIEKVLNGTTTTTITGIENIGVQAGANLFKDLMPFGTHIFYHYGRMFVVVGDIIYYSEPYNLEICDLRFNYIQMSSPIRIVAPVKEGVYIADDKTHFARFKGDPKGAILELIFEHSATPYTVAYSKAEFVGDKNGSKGNSVIWNSPEGIILGDDNGNAQNVSGRFILKGESIEGASLFRQQNGLNQYVVMEKQTGGTASNAAIGDQIGMEIRKGVFA